GLVAVQFGPEERRHLLPRPRRTPVQQQVGEQVPYLSARQAIQGLAIAFGHKDAEELDLQAAAHPLPLLPGCGYRRRVGGITVRVMSPSRVCEIAYSDQAATGEDPGRDCGRDASRPRSAWFLAADGDRRPGSARSAREQSPADGPGGNFGARVDAEFLSDVFDVQCRGAFGDDQGAGDLPAGPTAGHEGCHFQFAAGERVMR